MIQTIWWLKPFDDSKQFDDSIWRLKQFDDSNSLTTEQFDDSV